MEWMQYSLRWFFCYMQTISLLISETAEGFLRQWVLCCSYSVWLCGLYYGALHVLKSSRDRCPRVSSFLLAL